MRKIHPARALAWSECAMEIPGDRPTLALWQPEGTSVALGLSQDAEVEIETSRVVGDEVGLIRRQSGGGAVLLYPGVLCWEAFAPFDAIAAGENDNGIRASYRFLCGPVRTGLAHFGLAAVHAGICDISIPGADGVLRKIAGTAQLRKKRHALVHGSLLVCPDMDRLAHYLKLPRAQPDYRANRSHRDFCRSLAESVETASDIADRLLGETADAVRQAALQAGWLVTGIPAVPQTEQERYMEQDKYRNPEWNWRKRRPAF